MPFNINPQSPAAHRPHYNMYTLAVSQEHMLYNIQCLKYEMKLE